MFRIINFVLLLRYIAIATAMITIGLYGVMRSFGIVDISIISVISLISLLIILLITTNRSARYIWKVLKYFNSSLYPDLNGTWEGEIITEEEKSIPAKAVIRQTLITTQIDLHTETSKSHTLETTPAIESGQFKLYYMYRSAPKNPSWSQYTGTTIFDIRSIKKEDETILELSGFYFTDRKTVGRVRFVQINKDTSVDVSFY